MKKLHLSDHNKKILGVCSGLAESFNIPPNIVRLIFFIGTIWGGLGVVTYIALALILPKDNDLMITKYDKQRIYRNLDDKMVAGVCSGLAAYTKWDVSVIRIIFAVLSAIEGIGIVLYVVLWILLPKRDDV